MRTKSIPDSLTFNDVTLRPRRSSILPTETVTKTRFSRNVSINIPLSSAAMDKVTESRFAIAIAQYGGIGVIHKKMSIEQQRSQVDRVKRSESGMIMDPVTVTANMTIGQVLDIMKDFHISGVPVVDSKRRLVGILTNRDLRFESRPETPVGDLMTRENLITARVGTSLEAAKRMFRKHKIEKLPLVDRDYRLRGLMTFKDIQKVREFPDAAKDQHGRLRVAAAVGAVGDYLERAAELVKVEVDILVIDTAHGHTTRVIQALRMLKRRFPEVDVVAGNIAEYEAARDLIRAGADGIKIGMGSGSICTTRIVAGIGVPQLTAILECAAAARRASVPLIADGGVEYSGDITKAIAAGADSVMCGSIFAGTDETPGEIELYQGRSYKTYRGMGSLGAMQEGTADRYGQERSVKFVPEGVEGRVPHKGPLGNVIEQLVGGLQQGMGYMGCRTIAQLRQQSDRFYRVSPAGLAESHVHGITIVKEPPNYRQS